MLKYTTIRVLPFGLLLLSGSAVTISRTVTVDTPGYVALKAGDYVTSTEKFEAANIREPNNAFDELNLGASYQRQGRMDLAEPWYYRAMSHGHNVRTADTTTELSRGHTVEEIACQNLAMGLESATSEATAKPCQTVITFAVTPMHESSTSNYQQTTFNTYFEFNKASLTVDGQNMVNEAAREVLADSDRRISLVGNTSRIGTDAHNMELSRLRVNSVRDAMMAAGVESSRIDISWVGERDLPVAQEPGTHEPLNRVVEGKIKY